MNVRNSVDISKYAISLLHCSDHDVKAPCMFIGHRMLDIGQIWIMSEIEKKWVLQDQGSYDFMKGHWEDTRSHLLTDDDLLDCDISEEEIKETEMERTLKNYFKVQENCWLDLSY